MLNGGSNCGFSNQGNNTQSSKRSCEGEKSRCKPTGGLSLRSVRNLLPPQTGKDDLSVDGIAKATTIKKNFGMPQYMKFEARNDSSV